MSHYMPQSKLSQGYDEEYGEDDNLDDDDDDVDGYDCLSDDYDDELEYAEGSDKREGRPFGRAHHDGPSGSSRSGRNADLRRHRSISEGCPRVIEHPDDNRRDHHNHLERKRRASIKGSYTELREAIPGLRGSKASRAVTLQRAVEYIEELTKRNHEHTLCVETLTRQNEVLDRQVQDIHRNYTRMEEDEFAAVAVLDRSGLPPTLSLPTSFTQAPTTGPPSSSHQVRFISTSASSNSNSIISMPLSNSATTNSQSSIGSIVSSNNGVNNIGYPLLRVIQHDNTSDQALPTSGLAQLSYAALQLQQQKPVSISTSPPSSVARTVIVESTPSPSSSRVPVVVPNQRVRLSNSCSVVKTIKCTNMVHPSCTSSNSSSQSIVVVTSQPNHRHLIATTAAPPPPATWSGSVESSGDAASCFPLNTAVLKARNQAMVSKETQDVVPSPLPQTPLSNHHPRRVVIVSAQDPPNSRC